MTNHPVTSVSVAFMSDEGSEDYFTIQVDPTVWSRQDQNTAWAFGRLVGHAVEKRITDKAGNFYVDLDSGEKPGLPKWRIFLIAFASLIALLGAGLMAWDISLTHYTDSVGWGICMLVWSYLVLIGVKDLAESR